MLPVLHIGPLALQTPGLILLIGLWLGLTLAEKRAHRHAIHPNQIYTYSFAVLVAGALTARLTYVVRFSSVFASDPSSLISLNPDLLDPWGGLIGAALVTLFYKIRDKLNIWTLLDALTPALAVLAVATNLSNLASGDGYGAPSTVPWAIFLWGEWRHPAQIYEMIAAAAVLAACWLYKGHAVNQAGVYFLRFLAVTAAARLFFEAFRGDSALITGGLRSAQIIAWAILAICLGLLGRMRKPINSVEE